VAFHSNKEAAKAAERWMSIHADKYNEKSLIQTVAVSK
jgi:hypothetical protein